MITSALALVALVAWLVLVLDLRHRATLRAGRDPWEQVGPRRSVSTVGTVPPAPAPAARPRAAADTPSWVRAA